jgi:hemolysin activation/secretion protein
MNPPFKAAMAFRASASAVAIAGLMTLTPAIAQDFNRIAPSQPAPQPPGTVTEPAAKPIVPPAKNQLLLSSLKGLRFVSRAQDITRTGVQKTGIIVESDLPVLSDPAIQNDLAGFLGKPLYTNDLPRISQKIIDWYRAHQLPVVDVAFPEQDINSGTVQAVVTIYRLGKVRVSGNDWFSSDLLKSEMLLASGSPINFDILKGDLNRLNGNPFRQVGAVLERSEVPGDTDLALKVQDRFPLRVYAGYDNGGLPVTGRDQYSAGFNWGNAFGLDHQISYRFITTPDLWQTRNRGAGHSNDPRFMAHSGSYQAPLPWSDALSVFGSYVQQGPNLGANFDQVGHSLQMSLRYQKTLPVIGSMTQQIQAGFDYKRSDNNLAYGGTQISASTTNVEQFLLVYNATRIDAYGETAVVNQFVYSPGGLSNGNKTARYIASGVTGAKADYRYDNLQITRQTNLPWQLTSVIRLAGQIASGELLPSEKLGAGGSDSVRGYDPRSANGSQGLLASFELRSPSYSPLRQLGLDADDTGQLLVFYDTGFVSDVHQQTGQAKSASLQSLGFGLRYGISRFVDVRFDYGWQLSRPPGATQRGNLADISVTLAN